MAEELTLSTGLQEFSNAYMPAQNLAARTREEYARDLRLLAEFLEKRGISTWQAVALKDLKYYLAELDWRQLKASSRNRKTYAIKTFFTYLVEFRYISEQDNPALRLVPPRVPQKERRFLLEEEYQALLAQVRNPRDRAILEVLLQSGLRLSELAGLTTADVQLPRRIRKAPEDVGLVKVKRKGAKEGYIPLNWKACEALKA